MKSFLARYLQLIYGLDEDAGSSLKLNLTDL